MTYKQEDWQRAVRRLEQARQTYLGYKQQDKKARDPDVLDEVVWKCWTVGEYAINVCLEHFVLPAVKDHSQPAKARELYEAGKLSRDYSDALEKLERFRKKASHLGYVKERSVHYSSADLNRCLTEVEALCAETEALLQSKRRHP